jgi:hypothetical protein
MGFASDHKH